MKIRSLPDRVSSSTVYEKIMKMIENKQLPMVTDIDDGSANGVVVVALTTSDRLCGGIVTCIVVPTPIPKLPLINNNGSFTKRYLIR